MMPLRDVFERLRQEGFPLGVADFIALQRALELGEGIGGREELTRLCQLLWAKSRDEVAAVARVVDEALRAHVTSELEATKQVLRAPDVAAESPPVSASQSVGAEEQASPRPIEPAPAVGDASPAFGLEDRISVEPIKMPLAARRRAVLSQEFLPIADRQMKQSWRRLRRFVRKGPRTEPDVEATMQRMGEQGFLAELVLVARRVNDAGVILFVDRDGSMVPFHGYARQLEETARRGGRIAKLEVFYFHDCPRDVVFRDPGLSEAVPLDSVMACARRQRVGALIFSDAGAARRTFSTERIEESRAFIRRLQSRIRHVGWLNPVPRTRWRATSASRIREIAPMFELTAEDVAAAVRLLRGRRPWRRGHT